MARIQEKHGSMDEPIRRVATGRQDDLSNGLELSVC
jgi:hypothetical protein